MPENPIPFALGESVRVRTDYTEKFGVKPIAAGVIRYIAGIASAPIYDVLFPSGNICRLTHHELILASNFVDLTEDAFDELKATEPKLAWALEIRCRIGFILLDVAKPGWESLIRPAELRVGTLNGIAEQVFGETNNKIADLVLSPLPNHKISCGSVFGFCLPQDEVAYCERESCRCSWPLESVIDLREAALTALWLREVRRRLPEPEGADRG